MAVSAKYIYFKSGFTAAASRVNSMVIVLTLLMYIIGSFFAIRVRFFKTPINNEVVL